ncbi:MAG: DUF433 domain-containing protein [Chloroflexi bacterium]|nr:DUF433 domain-containing protein [Chloroflexota bacterium]
MALARQTDTTTAEAPQVVRNPKILGGEPTIRGTRIPVRSVVISHRRYRDLARVCEAYRLTPEAVEAALAFYEANRTEIDRHIRENEAAAED